MQSPFPSRYVEASKSSGGRQLKLSIFHPLHLQFDNKNVTWYDDTNKHIRNQYQDYVKDTYNMTVDGSKSLRVNFADFLSYEFAYKAMRKDIDNLVDKPLRLPGLHYSIEQFFWISAMQRYCHVSKDQETLQKLVLSSFPIESFRANNPLKNNFDFARDFGCNDGEKGVNKLYPRSFQEKNSKDSIKLSALLFAMTLTSIFV
jgi:predicted metalloendopeptidase